MTRTTFSAFLMLLFKQPFDLLGPVRFSSAFLCIGITPLCKRLGEQEIQAVPLRIYSFRSTQRHASWNFSVSPRRTEPVFHSYKRQGNPHYVAFRIPTGHLPMWQQKLRSVLLEYTSTSLGEAYIRFFSVRLIAIAEMESRKPSLTHMLASSHTV